MEEREVLIRSHNFLVGFEFDFAYSTSGNDGTYLLQSRGAVNRTVLLPVHPMK